ncbi:MAG: UDP-N-acetylmuramate dehydrogenase [Anaerolineae bacterium]
MIDAAEVPALAYFGDRLQRGAPLARYTAVRLGGPADYLVTARSRADLRAAVALARALAVPMLVLGGGANVLVSDAGFRGLAVVNRAQNVHFDTTQGQPIVHAESGASLSTLARRCIERGLSGLTWGVNVPGTVGGAVINNAGAHGGDMAAIVRAVEALPLADPDGTPETWPVEAMAYAYRASRLKGTRTHLVLGATLALGRDDPEALRAQARDFVEKRKATQPPGASLGSIFKNPPGDYAGRLIDAAGLKGAHVGDVEVSPVHANFFINRGGGTTADYVALIEKVRAAVFEAFGVRLELEVEVIGL